jgi:hypothetical protein
MLRLLETYYGITALDDASGSLSSGIIAPLKLGALIDVANRIDRRRLATVVRTKNPISIWAEGTACLAVSKCPQCDLGRFKMRLVTSRIS